MIDPRPEPDDDDVRRLCARFRARPAGVRNSLDAAGFELLLAFAQRAAVFAIRQKAPQWIEDGLTAIAIVDDERIDPADLDAPLALLVHAAKRIGADAEALLARAAAVATGSVAKRIKRAGTLPMQHQEIDGGFVNRGTARYEPSHDLGRMAIAIRTMLQHDRYRVESVTAATTVPAVWFASPDAAAMLARARGAASVHARDERDETQALMAFVAELDEARQLAPMPTIGGAAIVTVSHETLLAVLIARSFLDDVEPLETTSSLHRFIEPLRAILSRPA